MDATRLRYILFMLDSKIQQHDGKIFCRHSDAKDYAIDCIKENYCSQFIIGTFVMDANSQEMLIESIETFGFKGDVKDVNQLQLFSPMSIK